tara:strand:+ start:440 stop:682 length:243 start_codon:yes stop_codon:yes gene_type:complete
MVSKMFNGNILTVLQSDNKQNNGLIIPDNKSYKVVKVVESLEEAVEAGSLLYVPKQVGTEVEIGGINYMVVNIREILLVV